MASSTGATAKDLQSAQLLQLYETFPYPRTIGDLQRFRDGQQQPVWNPKSSFPVFFPEAKFRRDLDILVAGCGTNLAPVFAATMPEARVVGVDISGASLELSEALARENGIHNLEHHQLPLEEIETLGRKFDYVCCTGVIHHLSDPAAGLRALGSVLHPDGAMMIMVYARYGRQGIYMLQELSRMLGLSICETDAAKVQKLLTLLPERHPFRLVYERESRPISLEEVMDMVLNPRDVSYRVADIRTLVDDAGLAFHRWLGNAEYRPEFTSLSGAGLDLAPSLLDPWARAAAAELAHGTLLKHRFVLTHPHRASAEDLFAGSRIADAYPSLSGHIHVEHVGQNLVVTNEAHQVPVKIAAPVQDIGPLLKTADGTRTVGDLVEAGGSKGHEVFRRLYHADIIQLSLTK
ncbi:MAG: class I SAM-dependent methyltransferase [Nannocystaceae bacterium]|nr:class I SAM-dependent methyltransferase [Nannocystaceae bacterium]